MRIPFGLAALGALVAGCFAAAPGARATYPGDPGLIAYSSSAGYRDGSEAIWARSPFGGPPHKLTPHADSAADPSARFVSDYDPSWSPTGDRFTFTRETEVGMRVYIAQADGSGAHALVAADALGGDSSRQPDFGPNGRVAFVRLTGPGDPASEVIWSARADGTGLRRLADGSSPVWSPNGRRVVFDGPDGNLSVMRADGSHRHGLGGPCRRAGLVDFAPGGHRLVAVYSRSGSPDQHVYTMGLRCRHRRQVTQPGLGAAFDPVWSPDARWVAYFRFGSHHHGKPPHPSGIYLSRPDGSGERRVQGPGGFPLAWQPRP